MPGQKRQHYFPQVLQKNFIAKGEKKLWVYDRVNNSFRYQSPDQIAVQGHLYTLQSKELEDQRFVIEDTLASLEDRASLAFAKLRERQEISQSERNILCEYVAFQIYRTPQHLEIAKNISSRLARSLYEEMARDLATISADIFAQKIKEYEDKVGYKLGITQELILDAVNEGRIGVKEAPPDQHLGTMVEVATELAREFSNREWIVLHTQKGGSLIGGDCPVVTRHKDGIDSLIRVGPASTSSTNIFAFARDTALLIQCADTPRVIKHAAFSKKGIAMLNDHIAMESSRIIFSHSKILLNSIASRNHLAQREQGVIYQDEVFRDSARKIVQQISS